MKLYQFPVFILFVLLLAGCSSSRIISKQANKDFFHSPDFDNAHLGISIYDATANKTIYEYQGNKFFIPASNIKLFSCYAAMKYLGDSVPGIYYTENDTAIYLLPTGDPTLLHRDFSSQPVIKFLQSNTKKIFITDKNWKDNSLGFGWSWDDYNSIDMAERSPLPVYGNVIQWVQERDSPTKKNQSQFDNSASIYSIPEVNWRVRFNPESNNTAFYVRRNRQQNEFIITEGNEIKKEQDVPFITNGLESAVQLLADTIGKKITIDKLPQINFTGAKLLYSQPIDSLLRPMMYRSDNFFAEQCLLMVSQKLLNYMSIHAVVDTLLKADLKLLPERPRWVDGSGLSRYNLLSPQDIVWLLNKMQMDFGMGRIKNILPSGGAGTLSDYFKEMNESIFAKTGTLSNQATLSGFLYTRSKRLFIFSIMVNNHNRSASTIRQHTESFLQAIREAY